MEKLDEKATRIFAQLLEKLKESDRLRITNEGFMPLVMELVDTNITTPKGSADLYSLAHYYSQNGDAMRDPEMCFLVIDSRTTPEDYSGLQIYPTYFLMDGMGVEQNSIVIHEKRIIGCIIQVQRDHAIFSNQWLSNIAEQGFLQQPGHSDDAGNKKQ
ncbi:hypothetical protein [Chitinophaga sp. XS-30]|uniref:DUF6908 domain-containing protein n=1 Tax=Chitinophaga sp. XS-30 TaxID=2604421 RepID=UPI0011DE4C9A|nr:hypothetical protein [Chitinophaga sp. XS-30]QEH39424.1 hypothetical protein FW415_00465 [Chitinophaga sp. XS-30]